AALRPALCDVCRPGCGIRPDSARPGHASASLYPRAHPLPTGPDGPEDRPRPDPRDSAEPHRPAAGLPVSAALQRGERALHRAAASRPPRRSPPRGLLAAHRGVGGGMSVAPLLAVENLEVRFPVSSGWLGRREHVHAVNGVSLSVASGETLGIVG